MDSKELRGLYEAYSEVYSSQEEIENVEQIDEAEGSYGATPKAYSAASKTKMTAARKPFLKKMKSRTNPANRTDPYGSPRKGLTADDRERARAGSAHGVGTRQGHDYPSEGPGGITKSAKKLRKQKAMGEFAKEELDIFDMVIEFLQAEGIAETLEEAAWMMANLLNKEEVNIIAEASCEDDEEEKEMKKEKKGKKENDDEEEDDDDLKEASYSAKSARAGKDIGKPGKAFAKIAKSAAKRYGSKERGEKVAGAVLAKLRAKRG